MTTRETDDKKKNISVVFPFVTQLKAHPYVMYIMFYNCVSYFYEYFHFLLNSEEEKGGGWVVQSVQLATSSEEVKDSIPVVAARSLLVGSVSV